MNNVMIKIFQRQMDAKIVNIFVEKVVHLVTTQKVLLNQQYIIQLNKQIETYNICLSCEQTGYAPSSYYCRNICGDGLVVNGLYGYFQEYCDDGNNDSSSQCNSDCTGCAKGYQRGQNLKCEPVCGDRIKSIEEICESGNILPYKGCQNCLARCQVSCKICDIIFWQWLYIMQTWLYEAEQCMSSYMWGWYNCR